MTSGERLMCLDALQQTKKALVEARCSNDLERAESHLVTVLKAYEKLAAEMRDLKVERDRLVLNNENLRHSYDFLKIRNDKLVQEKTTDDTRLRHLRDEFASKASEVLLLKERIRQLERELDTATSASSGYGTARTPSALSRPPSATRARSPFVSVPTARFKGTEFGSTDSLASSRDLSNDLYSAPEDSILSGRRTPQKRVLPPIRLTEGEEKAGREQTTSRLPPKFPRITASESTPKAPLARPEQTTPDELTITECKKTPVGSRGEGSGLSPTSAGRFFPRMGAFHHRPSRFRRSNSLQHMSPMERGEEQSACLMRNSLVRATSEERLAPSVEDSEEEESGDEQFVVQSMDTQEDGDKGSSQFWTEDASTDVTDEQQLRMLDVFTRPHAFVEKRVYLRECCDICGRSIKFGIVAAKCEACRQTLHQDCVERITLPCAPRAVANPKTPSQTANGVATTRLADWCPSSAPSVPHLLVHAVLHLDRHHLDHEGLYRISGPERQVTELLQQFKQSRAVPRLQGVDPAVITSCIRRFLRSLKDELVPASSVREFAHASQLAMRMMGEGEGTTGASPLQKVILDLPGPHRDTLALLCLHWRRVTARSVANRMSVEALSRCLGPTIVGSSHYGRDLRFAGQEVDTQIDILRALLAAVPASFWRQFLVVHDMSLPPTILTLPRTPRANLDHTLDFRKFGVMSTVKRRPMKDLNSTASSTSWEKVPMTPKALKAKKMAERPAWK